MNLISASSPIISQVCTVVRSSFTRTTLSKSASTLATALQSCTQPCRPPGCRGLHSLRDTLSSPIHIEDDYEAKKFGYRVISPLSASSYTTTTTLGSKSSLDDDKIAGYYVLPAHVTQNSLGTSLAEDAYSTPTTIADTFLIQSRWEKLIKDEFVNVKAMDDPYLSDFETMDEEWESSNPSEDILLAEEEIALE